MAETGDAPGAIVELKGMKQVSDTGAIEEVVDRVIAANPGRGRRVPRRQGRAHRLLRGSGHAGDGRPGQPGGRERSARAQARASVGGSGDVPLSSGMDPRSPLFLAFVAGMFTYSHDRYRGGRRLPAPQPDSSFDGCAAGVLGGRHARGELLVAAGALGRPSPRSAGGLVWLPTALGFAVGGLSCGASTRSCRTSTRWCPACRSTRGSSPSGGARRCSCSRSRCTTSPRGSRSASRPGPRAPACPRRVWARRSRWGSGWGIQNLPEGLAVSTMLYAGGRHAQPGVHAGTAHRQRRAARGGCRSGSCGHVDRRCCPTLSRSRQAPWSTWSSRSWFPSASVQVTQTRPCSRASSASP